MPEPQLVDRFGQPVSSAALMQPPPLRRSSRRPPVFNAEPERLKTLFKAADDGDPRELQQLCADLEGRDGHFGGVLETRRRAVTRLAWNATADTRRQAGGRRRRRRQARHPQRRLVPADDPRAARRGGEGLVGLLDHLGHRGRLAPLGGAVVDQQMTAVTPEDDQRIAWRDLKDESKLQPILPYTAVVHVASDPSGPLYRRGIGRALAVLYSLKRLGLSAWASFIELFGVARPVVTLAQGASNLDADELEFRIQQWMHGGYLVKPRGVTVEFPEPANTRSGGSGGDPVQAALARYCDEQASKRIVGQTMTSDNGSSLAQGQVHERVAGWILEGDAGDLAETITRDLVEPYVRLNFGADAPIPKIAAVIESSERREFQLRALEVLVPLGLRVEQSIVRDLAGFPEPAEAPSCSRRRGRGRRRAARRAGAAGLGWSCRPGSARPSWWTWRGGSRWRRRSRLRPCPSACAPPGRGSPTTTTRTSSTETPAGPRARTGAPTCSPSSRRPRPSPRRPAASTTTCASSASAPSTATGWCATWRRRRCSCGEWGMEPMTWAELAYGPCPGVRFRASPTVIMPLPPAQFQALRSFLCDHFDATELMHLARGIWVDQPSLLHLLPPSSSALATLADVFIDTAQRHGFIDEEFFCALCAARPRLRDIIHKLWERSDAEEMAGAATSSSSRLRLRLELDLESLTPDRIGDILTLLRTISGDARMTIESISKGSAIFVLKGNRNAIYRIARCFSTHSLEHVAGFRVSEAEVVRIERIEAKSSPRDEELFASWRAGDKADGNALLMRHFHAIALFFHRNVCECDEVMHLVAETFTVMFSSTADVDNVSGELYRIAFLKLTNYLCRRKDLTDFGDDHELVAGDLTPEPPFIMEQPGETRLLLRASRRLPFLQQQVLELSIWAGKTGPEIAAILDVPIDTVASRLRLAHANLHDKVSELADSPQALRATTMKVADLRARVRSDEELPSDGKHQSDEDLHSDEVK